MMILELVDEAVTAGARRSEVAKLLEIDLRTVQRWRASGEEEDGRRGPRTPPANALSPEERERTLEVMNAPEFRDLSPKQIVPKLADRGEYTASESTMYRLLRKEGLLAHRGKARAPTKRHRPDELCATGPNQVWSWDITYLRSPVRGSFWYLYMVLDVWSRKIVAWDIFAEESSEHAAALLSAAYRREGVAPGSLVVHMDNGAPMKGATLLAKLEALGVSRSYSRPSVSNDNPYSESLFRTLKYRPAFPSGPFGSLEEAKAWVSAFVRWYNTEHLHSSITFVPPADRHSGNDVETLARRERVYEEARARRPERWSGEARNWSPVREVTLNPQTSATRSAG